MRALWACGLVLGLAGLVGCTGATEDAKGTPRSATPSPVMLAISGGVDVPLTAGGEDPELGKPCTPSPDATSRLGMEVRVTDDEGRVLGSEKIRTTYTRGSSSFKNCNLSFSFKVPGASESYKLTIGTFAPLRYSREDIRRGLSFYETEQGTLAMY